MDATQILLRFIVGVEANPRWRIDSNGKLQWGAGGGSVVDTDLERVAVGILQATAIRSATAPSVAADLTRKDYTDAQVALKLSLSGGTMTGFITLNADPTAVLHPVSKQYFDARVPAGGAVAKAGDTMTGTLTFDFTVSGTIIQSKIASEANPRYQVSSAGLIEWGAGGASVVDISLQRGAANRLDLLDQFRVTGDSGRGIDFVTDNTVDIGATLANRPRDIFAAGRILVGAGVVGTPSHSFDADPNTGLYNIGADILGLATAGVERLRIDASGRISLNSTQTTHNFAVSGAGGDLAFFRGTAVAPEFQSKADFIPAVDALIFRWMFQAQDSGAALSNFAELRVVSKDATAASEDARIELHYKRAGTAENVLAIEAPVDTETALLIQRNVAGVFTLQRVSMGAVDSGGAGFKLLRVPN